MRRDRLPTARAGEPMGPAREGSIDGVFPWSHGNGVRFIESTLIPGERRIGAEEGRVRGRDTFGPGPGLDSYGATRGVLKKIGR